MIGEQAGLQGGTPAMSVRPVDTALPVCGQPVESSTCTRKRGHYGPCGVAAPRWLLSEDDLIVTLDKMAESETIFSRQIILRQAVAMLRDKCK